MRWVPMPHAAIAASSRWWWRCTATASPRRAATRCTFAWTTAAPAPSSNAVRWLPARGWWSKESRCGRWQHRCRDKVDLVLCDLQHQLAEILAGEQLDQGLGEGVQALHHVFLAFHAPVLQVTGQFGHGEGEALG